MSTMHAKFMSNVLFCPKYVIRQKNNQQDCKFRFIGADSFG
jgi:hypothetical protein